MKPAFLTFLEENWAGWTPCQVAAWEALSPLFDAGQDRAQVGLLRGYAGTGKTHWVAQVVAFLEAMEWEVKLLTPTGRAAQVLARRLASTQVTVRPQTIHSCIYEIQPQDYSGQQLELFAATRPMLADERTITIIDEGSMVGNTKRDRKAGASFHFGSGSLLHDLLESIDLRASTDHRILFVGDGAQLPPVGDATEATPALTVAGLQAALADVGCRTEVLSAELRTIVRQEEGSLKAFIGSVRSVLESGEDLPRRAVEDVQPIESSRLMEAFCEAIDYGAAPARAVILAHSNKDVFHHNLAVRAALRRDDREVMAGEVLLVKRNVNLKDFGELEISSVFASLKNGTFVEVVGEPQPRRSVPVAVQGEEVVLRFWSARIRVLGHEEEADVMLLTNFLDPVLWLGSKEERLRRLGLLESAVLVDFQRRMQKEHGWRPARPGDDHYENYHARAKTDLYLSALRVAYGYSVTVHNAQGGEWPVVFVDPASNLAREWQHVPKHKMSFARWVYTASTRASESLYFIRRVTPVLADDEHSS
jgi:hypothetical protein